MKRLAKFGQLIYDATDDQRRGWCSHVSRYYHHARTDSGAYRIPHEHVRLGVPPTEHSCRFEGLTITIFGRTQRVAEWSKESGISRRTILARLARGWDNRRAVFTPSRKSHVTQGN